MRLDPLLRFYLLDIDEVYQMYSSGFVLSVCQLRALTDVEKEVMFLTLPLRIRKLMLKAAAALAARLVLRDLLEEVE